MCFLCEMGKDACCHHRTHVSTKGVKSTRKALSPPPKPICRGRCFLLGVEYIVAAYVSVGFLEDVGAQLSSRAVSGTIVELRYGELGGWRKWVVYLVSVVFAVRRSLHSFSSFLHVHVRHLAPAVSSRIEKAIQRETDAHRSLRLNIA